MQLHGIREKQVKKRLFFITIDGDGFIYKTTYDNRYVGEVFLEEIIKKYPFSISASISVGDIYKYPERFNIGLIKNIFKLDNVEIASHGWDHPHDWQGPGVDIKREIIDSVRYINTHLAPSNKKVKIFLWTGLGNIDEKCLRITDKLGISNLNGFGDKEIGFVKKGAHYQFISRVDMDCTYMGMEKLSREFNFGYEKTFSSYTGQLSGLKNVITFYESNPDLPIHLWLHWYSVVRPESLDAVKYVFNWFLTKDFTPVFASEYVKAFRKELVNKQ